MSSFMIISQIEKIIDFELKKTKNDKQVINIILDYLFDRCSGCNQYKYYKCMYYCNTCSFDF